MLSSIIIIGAGASGLIAARRLSSAGLAVTVLEAAPEPGGRIQTLFSAGFSHLAEGGAEFIHGDLPISLELAREAGIALHPVHARMARLRMDDEVETGHKREEWEETTTPQWEELMKKMQALEADQPIAGFLAGYFPGEEYAGLRETVRRYAEGYDLADLGTASTKALYDEWVNEGDGEEYRPEGGYRALIDFLVSECRRYGAIFHFSTPVTRVNWERGRVEVLTAGGAGFVAWRVLVSVSTGALPGLVFTPAIPDYFEAAGLIGFGSVIKILLEFKTPFWRGKQGGDRTLFMLSDQPVPTWWTQTAEQDGLLTGWLAGGGLSPFRRLDHFGRIDSCLDSLAAIFATDRKTLSAQLVHSLILDWLEAPYIRGGYSFGTIDSPAARKQLSEPVEGTLYFCGEALYEGETPGTVEAAFQAGVSAADKIIAQS